MTDENTKYAITPAKINQPVPVELIEPEIIKIDLNKQLELFDKKILANVFKLVNLKPGSTGYSHHYTVKEDDDDETIHINELYSIPLFPPISVINTLSEEQKKHHIGLLIAQQVFNKAIGSIAETVDTYNEADITRYFNNVKSAVHSEKMTIKDINTGNIDNIIQKLLKQSGLLSNENVSNIQPFFITDSYSDMVIKLVIKDDYINSNNCGVTANNYVRNKLLILFSYDYKCLDGTVSKVRFADIAYFDFNMINGAVQPRYRVVVNTPVVGVINFN